MSEAFTLLLSRLVRDSHFWPRERTCEGRVRELAEIYRHDGVEAINPIEVAPPDADGNYLLINGWGRVGAAIREGLPHLPAVVLPVASDEEAYELAVRLSSCGPQPLTRAEKRTAVDRLLRTNPRRADYAIAQIAGVSNHFVAKRRQLLHKPQKERAQGGARSLPPTRHALSIMKATKAIEEACLSASLAVDDGPFEGEMEAALAKAAAKCHGPEAGAWLIRLGAWLREAQGRLESGQASSAVAEEQPQGTVGGLERSNGTADPRGEAPGKPGGLERSNPAAGDGAGEKGEPEKQTIALSIAA